MADKATSVADVTTSMYVLCIQLNSNVEFPLLFIECISEKNNLMICIFSLLMYVVQ